MIIGLSAPGGVNASRLDHDHELGRLRERGIALGNEHLPEMAAVVREACAAGAFPALQRLANSGAIAFYLILGDVPGREEMALRLAAVNDALDPSMKEAPKPEMKDAVPADFYARARAGKIAYAVPEYSIEAGEAVFLDDLGAFESAIRDTATSLGREDLLATAEYLAAEAAASRCNALGLGRLMGTSSGPGLASMMGSLRLYVTAAAIDDQVAVIHRLREAFALALNGLAPGKHDGSGWVVERLIG